MYTLARNALFALPPEQAHDLSLCAIGALGAAPGAIVPVAGRSVSAFGCEFANPVGLAAGLDKDGTAIEGMARLGFGFVEVGTVTPRPQPGNERPRLFRLTRDRALINRMGFNNQGLEAMVKRLDRVRQRGRLRTTRLGVNVGKNKDTPLAQAGDDYVQGYRGVAPYADYVTVNLSSPNTPGLRALQQVDALKSLLLPLKDLQGALAGPPILVKLAPDLTIDEIESIAAVLTELSVDGVIATNTTIERPESLHSQQRTESGGLSGAPLHALAVERVALLRRALGTDVPLIGVGGIDGSTAAQAHRDAGADLVQVYTGFIYRGPALIREIARGF